MRPLGFKVIIEKKTVQAEQTSGTLIIELEKSTSDADDVSEGTVISVGNEVNSVIHMIDVGDTVKYENHGGYEVNIDGKDLIIADIKNILVVL